MSTTESDQISSQFGEVWSGIIRREQLAILVRQIPFVSLTNIVNSSLIAFIIATDAPLLSRLVWWCVVIAAAFYPIRSWLRSHKLSSTRPGSKRGVRRAIIVSGMLGGIWAVSAPLFAPYLSDRNELLLMIVLAGMAAGGTITLSSIPKAALAYVVAIGGVVLIYVLIVGTALYLALGLMLLLFFLVSLFASNSVYLSAAKALQQRAEEVEQRARMQERLHEFASISSDWFWESDADGVLREISHDGAERPSQGKPTQFDVNGKRLLLDVKPDTQAEQDTLRSLIRRHQAIGSMLCSVALPDGQQIHVAANAVPRFDAHGTFLGYRGTFTDLSAVLAAQRRAEQAESMLRDAVEAIPDALILYDSDDRVALFNNRHSEWFPSDAGILTPGVTYEEVLRQQIRDGQLQVASGHEEEVIAERLHAHLNPSEDIVQQMADGRIVRMSERRTSLGGIVAVRADITELTKARQEAQLAAERFVDFANSSADWFWETNADLQFTWMSPNVKTISGVSPEWHYGKTRPEMLGPDYDSEHWSAHLATMDARQPFRDFVYPRAGTDIETRWVSTSGVPVFDKDGNFQGYRGSARDVTAAREAELRLQQSERLRMIGQLTGGIAHDFNNLLTAIVGSLDLLDDVAEADPVARRSLEIAKEAGQRSADLTQQLLAFGRQQALRPVPTDVGMLIDHIAILVTRTFGGSIDIESCADSDLNDVVVDPTQLQNAMLNLAFNARDAMPEGGTLRFSARRVDSIPGRTGTGLPGQAGAFLEIAVSDNGTGMDPHVAEHAMEPFFTTKPVGQGSGLGLAMVHGFAAQSDGDLAIETAPGQGTTVKLFLPVGKAADVRPQLSPSSDDGLRGGNETILVVEDDPLVRDFVAMALTGLGYRILIANNGAEALNHIRSPSHIDLLLTDFALSGGMNGADVAKEFTAARPKLPIVVTSGHGSDTLLNQFAPDMHAAFLPKPASRRQLAGKIRDALDCPQQS